MRAWFVIVAALLLAACGGSDERAVLEATPPPGGGGGGGGDGGDTGDCRMIDGDEADRFTLTSVDGPLDDVQVGSVFSLAGNYHLVESDTEVYMIAAVCMTTCESVGQVASLDPGSGTYSLAFEVLRVLDHDGARNCLIVSMVTIDHRQLVTCKYHF
jgi:hypothetical protein